MTLTLQSVSTILQKPTKVDSSEAVKTEESETTEKSLTIFPHEEDEVQQSSPIKHADLDLNKSDVIHGQEISPPLSLSSSSYFNQASAFDDDVLSKMILNPNFMKSSKENYISPIFDTKYQQVILPVECGRNEAYMYLNKLCQGSKGQCILFRHCYWLTPNEFQFISGRETAKDWKRSIRHNGKSIKLLINKGILCVHSPLCECAALPINSEVGQKTYMTMSNNNNNRFFGGINTSYYNRNDYPQEALDENDPRKMIAWTTNGMEKIASTPLTSSCGSGSIDVDIDGPNHHLSGRFALANSHKSSCGNSVGSDPGSPLSGSSFSTNSFSSLLKAAESQAEEPTVTGSTAGMNNNRDSPTPMTKSKRKSKIPKPERHTERSGPSPDLPGNSPEPSGNSPEPVIPKKQLDMLQKFPETGRNYSDFMRSLAAKYNQQSTANIPNEYYRASTNFAFDTRFLKPAAAAALLNLGCSQLPPSPLWGAGQSNEKEKVDMTSTQTLQQIIRSASAAAALNLENLKANNNQSQKRPNSPLDLSSRDIPNTTFKKSKLRNNNSLFDMTATLKAVGAVNVGASAATSPSCMSQCFTGGGCTEEAQKMKNMSVEDVCQFLGSIDLQEYQEAFREHAIDGSSLPLLTEEHLVSSMNMKLGHALRFRSSIARKLGTCASCNHCTHCHSHTNNNASSSP